MKNHKVTTISNNEIATSLSLNGYGILKSSLCTSDYEDLKKALTVKPYINPEFAQLQPESNKIFSLFTESTSKIYIPKYYGLVNYGVSKDNKLNNGVESIYLDFKGSLRPEQNPAVTAIIDACKDPSKMGGILNVFCGGGKTTMALYILAQLQKKTLIVVHKDFLLNQWKERIEQFLPTARIGLIKAKVTNVIDCDIVLASLQSLAMKEYPRDVFRSFGTLIVDEVHHTSAEVFSQALRKTVFPYTIGLSATVTRKDGLSKVFKWFLGDIVYKSTKRTDTVNVIVKEYYHSSSAYSKEHVLNTRGTLNFARMLNNICAFEPRTEYLLNQLYLVLDKEPQRKVLVLSDRRTHLLHMFEEVKAHGKHSTGVYIGGMKQDALTACEDKQVIFATYAIAAEGLDLRHMDTLLLASPKGDIVQSVGRILRDKHLDRVPTIIDVVDCFSIFERQGQKRIKYYESQGYNVSGVVDKSKPVFEPNKCLF